MSKKFFTLQSILDSLYRNGRSKPSEILLEVGVSKPTLHKYLSLLVEEGRVLKTGAAPHVFYRLADIDDPGEDVIQDVYYEHDFDYEAIDFLDRCFLKYSPDGRILSGVQGFMEWCTRRGLDPVTSYDRYRSVGRFIDAQRDSCGLLDASESFSKIVDAMFLDKLYYADQYKWQEFGRGRLAEQGFFAKQTQHKKMLEEVCQLVATRCSCLIKGANFDALAFTPPSLKRQIQILTLLDSFLSHVKLPRVRLVKEYANGIVTPQKSLKKRSDRILNAKRTIYVDDPKVSSYDRVLLIDDFVGSGSTLNETSKKLKKAGVKEVVGFAMVGNLNLSYDVISEM